jgi:hypothetical protein
MKELITEFRLLIAWTLIGWSFKVAPKESHEKITLAAAIKLLFEAESFRKKDRRVRILNVVKEKLKR